MNNGPHTNDHDRVSSEDIARMEERWNRWVKPLAGTGAVLFLIALYVFGYPIIVVWLSSRGLLNDTTDFVDTAILYSMRPLNYLHDSFVPYEIYFNWLRRIFYGLPY